MLTHVAQMDAAVLWTFEHIVGVITAAAAIAAVVAAVRYGRKGIRATQAATTREADRFARAGRPRVSASFSAPPSSFDPGARARVAMSNSSGPALPACIILCDQAGRYWCGLVDLPAHTIAVQSTFTGKLNGITGPPGSALIAARDSQGVWWDQRTDRVIEGPAVGEDGLIAWWVSVVFAGVDVRD